MTRPELERTAAGQAQYLWGEIRERHGRNRTTLAGRGHAKLLLELLRQGTAYGALLDRKTKIGQGNVVRYLADLAMYGLVGDVGQMVVGSRPTRYARMYRLTRTGRELAVLLRMGDREVQAEKLARRGATGPPRDMWPTAEGLAALGGRRRAPEPVTAPNMSASIGRGYRLTAKGLSALNG